ncbi:MAG: hypothetical protein AAF547_01805 [Actinomycetota bacterium]
MVEAVRAGTKGLPTATIDRAMLGGLAGYVLPVLMAVILAVSLNLTLERAGELRTWLADFSGAGTFLVQSCAAEDDTGAPTYRCAGRLTTAGADQSIRTSLVTSRQALTSDRPYLGERLEVFHAEGDRSVVYPVAFRLNELTRVYLTLLPRLLLFVGAVVWLAGWFLTRNLDPEDVVTRDGVRIPQRFGWRARGINWIAAAALVLGINYLVTTRVIGSLGTL